MSTKLTVIFYILLSLQVGIVLAVLPWVQPFNLVGDWGDNYFLLYAAQRTGLQGLQAAISSGWARGAVTGLGLLNIGLALWELVNFRRSVRALDHEAARASAPRRQPESSRAAAHRVTDEPHPQTPANVPHHERSAHP